MGIKHEFIQAYACLSAITRTNEVVSKFALKQKFSGASEKTRFKLD